MEYPSGSSIVNHLIWFHPPPPSPPPPVGWRVRRLWRGSHAVTGRKRPEVLEQEQKRIELEEEAWEKMLQKDAEMRGHREAHEAVLLEAGIPSPYVQSAPGSS